MKPVWKKLLWTLALLVIAAGLVNHFARSFYGIQYVSVHQPEVFRFLRHEEVLYPASSGGTVAVQRAVFAFRFSGKKPRTMLARQLPGGTETRPLADLYYSEKQPRSGWQRGYAFDCGLSISYLQLQPDTDYELLAAPISGGSSMAHKPLYACAFVSDGIYRSEPLTIPLDPR